MKRKLTAFLLAAAVLVLAGCSLAQPEQENSGVSGDALVGLYAVHYDSWEESGDFYGNPNLVEYGSTAVDTEYGKLSIPDMILVGEYDEENHTCTFPGMKKGWSLFSLTLERDGAPYNTTVCDMVSSGVHYTSTDEGEGVELEGTLYVGPPAGAGPDWDPYSDDPGHWQYYQVYQMADGTIYLNGHGDSVSGGGGYTLTAESTTTINGESTTRSVKATVNIEDVERLEKLVVSQFDKNNTLLQSQEIALGGELSPLTCGGGAAWVLVEEHNAHGITRAAYTLPAGEEEPVRHRVVLLDDKGVGEVFMLEIQ